MGRNLQKHLEVLLLGVLVTAERADIGRWAGVRHVLYLHPIKLYETVQVTAGAEEPQPLNKELFVKV